MRDHFIAGFGQTRAALLGDLFDREAVDLAICDDIDVGAVIAAERRGIPCVTVNVIVAGLLNHPAVVGSAWDQLRRNQGLASDQDARLIGGELVIAPSPRSLRSPDALVPAAMRFVRPPILDEHRSHSGAATGRSLVYVTLGTVFNLESGDLLARLVQAMNMLSTTDDVDAVIAIGPNIDTDDLPSPAPGFGSRISFRSGHCSADATPSCATAAPARSWTHSRSASRPSYSRWVPTSPTTPTDARHSAPASPSTRSLPLPPKSPRQQALEPRPRRDVPELGHLLAPSAP